VSSTRVSIFIALTYFIVEKLRVKLWKKAKIAKVAKILDPWNCSAVHCDLGDMLLLNTTFAWYLLFLISNSVITKTANCGFVNILSLRKICWCSPLLQATQQCQSAGRRQWLHDAGHHTARQRYNDVWATLNWAIKLGYFSHVVGDFLWYTIWQPAASASDAQQLSVSRRRRPWLTRPAAGDASLCGPRLTLY